MKNLTELEKQMIEQILHDYEIDGIENTEFHNMTWDNEEMAKKWRGTFTSLKRKKIVSHYNDKGCFNPIFPTQKLVDVCEENGIEIKEEVMEQMKPYLQ